MTKMEAESHVVTSRREIFWIDCQIDRNHRALQQAQHIDTASFESWGNAWRAEPRLAKREEDLYRRRGKFQQDRDRADYHLARLAQRQLNARPQS